MEEVTRTFQVAIASVVENIASPVRQGEPIGSQWGTVPSPPGRTRVVLDRVITPSPIAGAPNVTPTPVGTPLAKSPDISSGTRHALMKRKEPVKTGAIYIGFNDDSDKLDSSGSSPSETTGTNTRTPTPGSTPTAVGTLTKSPNTRIITRASETKSKEKKVEEKAARRAAQAEKAGGLEARTTRSKDNREKAKKMKTQ